MEEDPISMCNIDVPQSHKTSELLYFVTLKNCRRQLGLEPAFHELERSVATKTKNPVLTFM